MLLSHFSHVRLCATPKTEAHQAPLSLGFSRQEHWSGLPFPSPMHESEQWKWSHSVVSTSSWPHGLQPTRLLHPWDFPGKSTGVGRHCLLQIINIHVLKIGAPKYMRQLLMDIKGEINSNAIIVWEFNTPLIEMNRSFIQKISNKTLALSDTLYLMDLIYNT